MLLNETAKKLATPGIGGIIGGVAGAAAGNTALMGKIPF